MLAAILLASFVLPTSTRAGGVDPDTFPFRLGDRIAGAINYPGDEDAGTFQGLAGAKIQFHAEVVQGGSIEFLVRDESGAQVAAIAQALKAGEKGKLKFKLAESGVYTLVARGVGVNTGVYFVRSKGKLPGSAKSKTYAKIQPKGGSPQAAVTFAGMTDTTLTLDVALKKFEGGPVLISLVNPLGSEMFAGSASTAATIVQDLPLPLPGSYEVRFTGFPSNKAFAQVSVALTQPKGDKDTTILID